MVDSVPDTPQLLKYFQFKSANTETLVDFNNPGYGDVFCSTYNNYSSQFSFFSLQERVVADEAHVVCDGEYNYHPNS